MTAMQDAIGVPLERLRRVWRTSPLPPFFAWWGGELHKLLPSRVRSLLDGGAHWFLLERDDHGWSLRRAGETDALVRVADDDADALQTRSLIDAMAGVDPADRYVALCLPFSDVLRRRLVLPLAARDNLRQVVGYDVDRQTPFRSEDVHFGVRELTGPAPEGRFVAELAAVPRTRLDPLLDRLQALGIPLDRVDVVDGAVRAGVDLLPPGRATRRVNARGRTNMALAVACVLLIFACMAGWLHNRESALDAMRDQVESMRGDAQRVAALRQRLTDSAGASGFLAQRKAEVPAVLPVLNELTHRLPDDTWLERFTLNASGQIGFQGQSPQAARLIDTLKGATYLGEPSFQGTIQTDPTSGKERFYMQARAHVAKPEVAHANEAR
ncbi:general secretion pathway protein L [Luteibacter rhizovicinus]|uniref:General secretion pathway protein L n=1 Tax=Luteibacter rhizovicinus TaxID=242606 RepID=A0A4R3YLS9_9GAMM|nr:type II secretion system protein GspL [Luteibacter rhizovicinus]TCV92014.1 general secretion pathway protein L [Luteibacter rhizovicinus]